MVGETQRHSRLFQEVVHKSWWTILFFFLCFFAYDRASSRKNQQSIQLQRKWEALTAQKEAAARQQAELKLQIASQDDPAWIEMTLMKELGLVPAGCTKVHFIDP